MMFRRSIIALLCFTVLLSLDAQELRYAWQSDFGWSANFTDEYNLNLDQARLSLSTDLGAYHTLSGDLLLEDSPAERGLGWEEFILATDLAGYFGWGDSALMWRNGFFEQSAGAEYADLGIVGYADSGAEWIALEEEWSTQLQLDYRSIWIRGASTWNLWIDETDPATVNADSGRRMQLYAGSVDLIPGLAFEAGMRMDPDQEGLTSGMSARYSLADRRNELILGASYAYTTLSPTAQLALYGLDTVWYNHLGGAGMEYRRHQKNDAEWYLSLSVKGRDTASLIAVGGGIGYDRGLWGAELAFAYDSTLSAGEGTLAGIDLSLFAPIEPVLFTIGLVYSDGYGWSNNAVAPLSSVGGLYLNIEVDF